MVAWRLWSARRGLVLLAAAGFVAVLFAVYASGALGPRGPEHGPTTAATTVPGGGHIEPSDPRVAPAFALLRTRGLAAAMAELEAVAARDSAVLRDAHQLTHALGRDAVMLAGDASALKVCQPVFGAGCYHGVVEGFLQTRGRIDMAELERLCAGARTPERRGGVYECIHGLGHGVFGASGLDLDATLHDCDRLSGAEFASWCHAGAFMEAVNTALADADGASNVGHVPAHQHGSMPHDEHGPARSAKPILDPADPYSPCDRFTDPYAASCWMFQAFVILREHHFDATAGFRTCDKAPDGQVERCYAGLGLQLAGLFQRDGRWIVSQCTQGQPRLAPSCAAGAARVLGMIDWSGGRGVEFCRVSPVGWKRDCYQSVLEMLAIYGTRDEWQAACLRIEPDYTSACRKESPSQQS